MAKQSRANTAQELKEKYGHKRLSSSTAGKSLIYSYLYNGYQVEERVPGDKVQPLYKDIDRFKDRVETVEDAQLYNAYVHLLSWTMSSFETSIFIRNNAQNAISHLFGAASTALAGEELKSILKDQGTDQDISQWLKVLTLERYSINDFDMMSARKNIDASLRYLNAYNTFVELTAAATAIPEYTFFKVEMTRVTRNIEELNITLDALREGIRDLRGDLPDQLKDSMRAFEPVEAEAPPIPKANIRAAKEQLREETLNGTKSWTATFTDFRSGYWRHY